MPMSVKERIEALVNKLRETGLMYPEFNELCELLRKRDDDKYATKAYWEM